MVPLYRTSLLFSLLCLVCAADDNNKQSCAYVTQRTQCGHLACNETTSTCSKCQQDTDCYPSAMYCYQSEKDSDKAGTCQVKSFFSSDNFSFLTVLAMIFACLIGAIGVVAGVGGGGMLVPMFCICLSLPMESAVGLSQSTICGQSTLNMYFAVQQHFQNDQNWKRPLINYQYLSLLLPLGLMGTMIGGQLSKVCPDFLRLLLLFLLLSVVLYRTVIKMKQQYAEDHEANKATEVVVTSQPAEEEENETNDNNNNEDEEEDDNNDNTNNTNEVSAKDDQEQYPKQELGVNFAAFFIVLFFNIIRQYTSCGGFWYWCCLLLPLLILGGIFYYAYTHLQQLTDRQRSFAWNTNNTVKYPLVAVIAGAAASMLGIGGGLVLGFVLYEVGLTPEETSATSGMSTFFIAFSAALQLLVGGKLLVDYGLVFFIVGLCATAVSTFYLKKKIKENGWNFLIVGALAFIVGGSLVVLGAYGIYNAVVTSRLGGSIVAFGRLCPKSITVG
ncbi:hypothetical protein AGDE_01798 [Angomonas deanei]|uniref:Sulfite exporter TauE/SafE, putative n=1 Tax=Angomonas deanei TaxID=59799 RepID=A0A7G2CGP7_9TRYP|nr:hypothetical protein AGDE_01798 [Angomonas deanei]CAD2218151.1 Sulfite exporter TauE/SafE, putative [Angomonas deanei]|eukprot:EPY42125.1 hypothetical protein AGDE_01798 [Angomonas deanei]